MNTVAQPQQETETAVDSLLLAQYRKQHHRKVLGWLTPGALDLIYEVGKIQNTLPVFGHAAEIGVHHGKLFILLHLLLRPDEQSVAIDLFDEQSGNVDDSGRGNFSIFRKNLSAYAGDNDRVNIIKADSLTLGPGDLINAAGGKVRLFSVDGGHTSEITRRDLALAADVLTEGGVIILDDYFNEQWPSVSVGANQYMNDTTGSKIHPFLIGGNKLFFTNDTGYADRYRRALEKRHPGAQRKKSVMFGCEVLCVDFTPLTLRERAVNTLFWEKFREASAGRLVRTLLGRR